MTAIACSASDFHPYECDGPSGCIHCDRLEEPGHDPQTCELCRSTPIADIEDWETYWRGGEVSYQDSERP